MKKSIQLLILSFVILGFSCTSKEDSNPDEEYFIKFRVNGKEIRYKATIATPLILFFDSNGPIHQGAILVLGPGSDGTKNAISINLRNETEFQSGISYEMQNGITYQTAQLARINFSWFDENGDIYNAVILKSAVPNLNIVEDASLRFNVLSANVSQGTFSAILIGPVTNTGRGNTEMRITEGEFKLPVVRN